MPPPQPNVSRGRRIREGLYGALGVVLGIGFLLSRGGVFLQLIGLASLISGIGTIARAIRP